MCQKIRLLHLTMLLKEIKQHCILPPLPPRCKGLFYSPEKMFLFGERIQRLLKGNPLCHDENI